MIAFANLNDPGDNRFLYADPRFTPIKIIVSASESVTPHEEIETWLQEMTDGTVEKQAEIIFQDNLEEEKAAYANGDLNRVRKKLKSSQIGKPVLNVVYLTSYAEKPSYLGVALHRDTIFIFKSTMIELQVNETTRAKLEKSTLMHEWGHLLGLSHVDLPSCIMSSSVEVIENRVYSEASIPTQYCWNSEYELEQLRSSVQ